MRARFYLLHQRLAGFNQLGVLLHRNILRFRVGVDIQLDLRLGAGRTDADPFAAGQLEVQHVALGQTRARHITLRIGARADEVIANGNDVLARQRLGRILAEILHDFLHLRHAVLARQGDGNDLLDVIAVGLVDFLKDIVKRLALRLSPCRRFRNQQGRVDAVLVANERRGQEAVALFKAEDERMVALSMNC